MPKIKTRVKQRFVSRYRRLLIKDEKMCKSLETKKLGCTVYVHKASIFLFENSIHNEKLTKNIKGLFNVRIRVINKIWKVRSVKV